MTNEELKTAITKALEDITITWKEGRNEAISFILAELQPLVDADREKIKELEAEVKRLKEQINDYEVTLGLVAKKARRIVGVVNRNIQGKEPF